jgi:hypothetical protein
MPKFVNNLEMSRNQLLNVLFQVLAGDPGSPAEAQFWYDSTTGNHVPRFYNGTSVKTFATTDDVAAGTPDATTTVKGKIKLAQDLGGTADLPTVTQVGGASAANIADAVTKRHTQNTDTGTTATSFQLDSGASGPRLKNSSGEIQARNAADNAYANLHANDLALEGNLTVNGTTTHVNSTTVDTGDNQILLNSLIATNAANTNGGIALKRLAADNTTRRDAELNYNVTSNRWETVQGVTTSAPNTFTVANKVTATIGDGSSTSIAITHNLGTKDVHVSIRDTSTDAQVLTDIVSTSTSVVTLSFAVAPTTNQYTVTIIG